MVLLAFGKYWLSPLFGSGLQLPRTLAGNCRNRHRNIQQELIYHFLKGNYGPFLPLDEYDTEMEVYTNFANIGYINKEFQEDPHMAVYIELFKKHFKITYINNGVIRKYEEFNSIDEIFSSIENTCKSLVEK